MNYDIIIIGAGLGGLTAGAKLARAGKKVLLLEHHDRPGGCATTFKRKGFTMEVGLHEMDGLHAGDMKSRVFRDLGVFDKVEFLKVPEFYRFVNGRQDVLISHDPEDVAERLSDLFPQEKEGIKKYFHQLMNIRRIMKESTGESEKNLGEFMDEIITNDDLKLILLGNLGYFHDDPYSLSLSYYSMAQSSYYQGGGNFIKGGSQKLSDYFVEAIEAAGGEVLLNTLATEILVDGDKATGVAFIGKKDPTVKRAMAECVIANASVPLVAETLLPEEYGAKLSEQYEDLEPGASLLTVYFGFNRPLKEINKYYSTFLYSESVKNQEDIKVNNAADFSERSFTFVDYSHVDSDLAPDGKSVGAVCCIDYTDQWDELTEEEYKERKEKSAQAFIDRLERLIPGFREALEYYEVATASSVRRYTLNPNGAVYGFAQTPERVQTDIESPLENLHFASAWTKTGGGFSGAIFSGYLCAMDIMRKSR
jgi:all-trans-retinol 13,14-reductase